jgi:hypothetical protein
MKLFFFSLHPNRANVYLHGTSFELLENDEIQKWEWSDSNWSRVDDDYRSEPTTELTRRVSLFCRDEYKIYASHFSKTSPGDLIVWLDPIPYCPTSRSYHGHQDYPKQNVELNKIGRWPEGLGGWMQLCAFAQKYAGQPPYVIKRQHYELRDHGFGKVNVQSSNQKRGVSVGPWLFWDKDKYGYDKAEEDARQLKLWIHGRPSKLDAPKDIMRRAARRRIVKHRATRSDIQFFQTLFGVSQVGKWIEESISKKTHNNE